MLPLPFDSSSGGSAFGHASLNDENREVPEQWISDPGAECRYWVGMSDEAPPGGAQWETIAESPFLDASRSPALWRAFYVPILSQRSNAYTSMTLKVRTDV
jgi:hypothetical protein